MGTAFNENHYRTFEASCETFSGFQVNINITKIDTIDDIDTITEDMIRVFSYKSYSQLKALMIA